MRRGDREDFSLTRISERPSACRESLDISSFELPAVLPFPELPQVAGLGLPP